jgi:cyanophycin synthetase
LSPSFEDSRRLTGPNLYFADCGAVLATLGAVPSGEEVSSWRSHVGIARAWLRWPDAACVARPHRSGAALAIAAPVDQLFTATEVNEWAWQRARGLSEMFAPGHPAAHDDALARATLQFAAHAEADAALTAVIAAARSRGVQAFWDDELLTVGAGAHAWHAPLVALPKADAVPWHGLANVPCALVSGSNGKTTSVRLIAAMLRAHGLFTGHCCTDGLFFDGRFEKSGDYSGPAGARAVLRDPRVQAAVLETARGGILRRGLAVRDVDVALVTNVSADHFGEYGIDTLEDLADTKLTLARGLKPGARLVVNADDAVLAARALLLDVPRAWFAFDHDHPQLVAARAQHEPTCGVRAGRIVLTLDQEVTDLGAVVDMPLTLSGAARYNIANLLGAALSAAMLGIDLAHIRNVMAHFGSSRDDNPGRLQCFRIGSVDVVLDYAHNPEGLSGLLELARQHFPGRRQGLVLGQAGNRDDTDIRALADAAFDAAPAFIVLKEIEGMLRGRQPGEVPNLLRTQLVKRGFPESQLLLHASELAAAKNAWRRAQPDDVLILPIHAKVAREKVIAWLEELAGSSG